MQLHAHALLLAVMTLASTHAPLLTQGLPIPDSITSDAQLAKRGFMQCFGAACARSQSSFDQPPRNPTVGIALDADATVDEQPPARVYKGDAYRRVHHVLNPGDPYPVYGTSKIRVDTPFADSALQNEMNRRLSEQPTIIRHQRPEPGELWNQAFVKSRYRGVNQRPHVRGPG
jgi:hypothetical protein